MAVNRQGFIEKNYKDAYPNLQYTVSAPKMQKMPVDTRSFAQHRQKSMARDGDFADIAHFLLAFLLLLEQLLLAGEIPSVQLAGHVLAVGGERLAGDDFAADRRLD